MIDMGLTGGVRSLWEDDLLCDYTIKVEECEFQVHKVVLASVSEYFRVMFTGSMKESQTDRVELKELSADTFSKLLELIYTGEEDIVNKNAVELFPCAVYLDIKSATRECRERMLEFYNVTNCLDVLSLILTYEDTCDLRTMKNFIMKNWSTIWENCSPKKLTQATLQFLADMWKGSEWELFCAIKDWIGVDKDDRIKLTDDLMSYVRFPLMTPQELAAVMETPLYLQSSDAWRELVDKAIVYHKLPMYNKVLQDSEQTTVRIEAEPVFFAENDNIYGSKTCAVLKNRLERTWETQNIDGPRMSSPVAGTVHVNNFLICYTELDKGQTDWYIFDARTLEWAEMASMLRPKADFAVVHYDKHLYVLGGQTDTQALTKTVEQYDFRTNKWKSTRRPLPVPAAGLHACVLNDAIYCCGGSIKINGIALRSTRLDCLDLSTHKWESRAPMMASVDDGAVICVMKMSGDDVVVFARKDQVDTYNPNTDQWSVWREATLQFSRVTWDRQSWLMAQGGTIYWLNIIEVSNPAYSSSWLDYFNSVSGRVRRVCVRWTMVDKLNKPFRLVIDDVPVPRQQSGEDRKMYGALLSIPYHKLTSSRSDAP